MSAPRWAVWLLVRVAPEDRVAEVVGDLEEAHAARRGRRGARVRTGLEALDVAVALVRERRERRRGRARSVRWEARAGRSSLGFSWLDVKLGARMLARYPGVTIVGGLALAIGVGAGAGYAEVLADLLRPSLPLPEGDRIVGIRTWDATENDPELRTMGDFVVWRETLETVGELSAFTSVSRNIGGGAEPGEPATGAAMTPSAFRLARVPALHGRTLIEADEAAGAEPVIVLGYDLWRARFLGDPSVVGRSIRVGDEAATVVGVMPEGFAFPVSHAFWVPLRVGSAAMEPGEGPAIQVFGRLVGGASRADAGAELAAVGAAAATASAATHGALRPRVVRYTELYMGGEGSGPAQLVQVLFVLLLLILASNVATLVFARTATRENEVTMRFALGASRGRIVAQFFAEALVLALAAAAVGLVVAAAGARWLTRFVWDLTEGAVPFWLDGRLDATTVLYALGLAVLAAAVAGVVPALRVTRSRLQARLRHAPGGATGGTAGGGLRFGGLWGGMIVVQVAFAVLVMPPALVALAGLADPGYVNPGFPADEYLSARLEMDAAGPPSPGGGRDSGSFPSFEATFRELEERLLAAPGVTRVTFASRLPGMDHPQPWVDVDTAGGVSDFVMSTAVDVGFFDAFGAEIVAGRAFHAGDAATEAPVVVVNELFVRDFLGGRNAIGRRIRYSTLAGQRGAMGRPVELTRDRFREPGEWLEIVGVVRGLGMDTNRNAFWAGEGPGVYHPLAPASTRAGGGHVVRVAVHVRGDASAFAPRLRELAHAVDPALRLHDVLPLDRPVDRANRGERVLSRMASWLTAIVAAVALLISVAGLYSVMSFTVARRTREIGIRIALGADRARILSGVFSRALLQIGLGIVAGTLVWFYVIVMQLGGADRIGLLFASAGILALVGLAACGVPVRRALRIEPSEALRETG